MEQREMPLVKALMDYIEQSRVRMHMPGHKGRADEFEALEALIGEKVFQADFTELPGLDDLHNPQGVILQAQELAAQAFGAAASFFLVNGATAGITAAIMAYTGAGGSLLLPRSCHRSVVNGLILSGARPVYIPNNLTWAQIPLPLLPAQGKNAVDKHPHSQALCLTSPTYEGLAVDFSRLTSEVKAKDIPLIVDEAHGAHFYFHHAFPKPALKYKAEAVIHGAHKTLGSLTQTGLLHLSKAQDVPKVSRALDLLQSTSPSYVLMASLDGTRQQAVLSGPERLERLLELGSFARQEINRIKGFWCPGAELFQDAEGVLWDPTKLIIVSARKLTGYQLANILRADYKIDVEMARENYVLAMLTMGDEKEDVVCLIKALQDISGRFSLPSVSLKDLEPRDSLPLPEVVLTPREAFFSPLKTVPFSQALGKISGELIAPYPPGIPLICPGERLDHVILECMEELKGLGVHWQGPGDPTLATLRILDV